MTGALLIMLDRPLPDAEAAYVKTRSGRALFRESSRLDLAARTVKVPPLTALLSENQVNLIAQLRADGFDPSRMRLPPEQWFTPAEGLLTMRALLAHVSANLNNFKQPNPILKDLKAAEQLLQAAEEATARFHLANGEI